MPYPTWISQLPRRVRRLQRPAYLGTLRSLQPLSDEWGFDRGTPVDRYYIEGFLARYRSTIRGHVLEMKNNAYTRRFGSGVHTSAVLDIDRRNRAATIITDLMAANSIADHVFDCFILTQTLQFIADPAAALYHAWRVLRPGGVLLMTVPCISRLAPRYGLSQEYWRFTAASCRMLLEKHFQPGQITIQTYGNVLSTIAFLSGMASEELEPTELQYHDPFFPLIIAVQATKTSDEPNTHEQ